MPIVRTMSAQVPTREAADIMAKLTVILRACGNSEVAGLVASTHVSTHEILRARVGTIGGANL